MDVGSTHCRSSTTTASRPCARTARKEASKSWNSSIGAAEEVESNRSTSDPSGPADSRRTKSRTAAIGTADSSSCPFTLTRASVGIESHNSESNRVLPSPGCP